jgi:hypothetical protein
VRETFMVAQYDGRVERITDKYLEDAIDGLRKLRQKKTVQQSRRELTGDDRLRDFYSKLKQKHPTDNSDAS